MKQILLITDGCSNVGVSPVVAAAQALAEDIIVNVVGIVGEGEMGRFGMEEIAEIARAGGGMSRIVRPQQLSHTVQMMTRKTVSLSIQQAVQQELKDIVGSDSVEDLPPAQRSRVVRVIDNLSESAKIQVALLIDTSASMKPKLPAVEDAVHDLGLSLQARKGESEIAVFRFPGSGKNREGADLLGGWTAEVAKLDQLFYKLSMKGSTPTGPAILAVLEYMASSLGSSRRFRDAASGNAAAAESPEPDDGDGMMRDYLI